MAYIEIKYGKDYSCKSVDVKPVPKDGVVEGSILYELQADLVTLKIYKYLQGDWREL